jgi:hypothetical protein
MVLRDSAEVMETVAKKRFLRKSPFLEFCDAEGLPVITGYGVEDLRTVPLSHWERLGGLAAYCHLEGSQGFVGSMVAEIPPGKNLKPMRHLYEELILILEGCGATQFWCEKTNQTILLEWQAGSLFSRRSTSNTISTARQLSRCASLHRATRRLFLMLLLLLTLSSTRRTNSPIGFRVRATIFRARSKRGSSRIPRLISFLTFTRCR